MSETLLQTIGVDMSEENKPATNNRRGSYYVCDVRAEFDRKRDLVEYIEKNDLSDESIAVIRGNRKAITRESIPQIDVK
jgi:hypothetical protein